MAAARRPRVLYRLCVYEGVAHCTSFRRGHVTRPPTLVLSYPMPLPRPTHDSYVQGVAVKRTGVIFKVSRKGKGTLLCKITKIKKSHSSL